MDISTLPKRIEGPSAWLGPEMTAHPDRWLRELSGAEVAELAAAGRAYLALGRDVGEITRTDFPLPRLEAYLTHLRTKLLHGCGVEVLRGLPVQNYPLGGEEVNVIEVDYINVIVKSCDRLIGLVYIVFRNFSIS